MAIDGMLRSDALTYADYARMAADDGEGSGPSLLRGIFNGADTQAILVAWLAETNRDSEIESKGAAAELRDVLHVRLGLSLPDDTALPRMRANAARHVLGNEFLADFSGSVVTTAALGQISCVETKDQEKTVREVARRLRERHSDAYMALADRVEGELGLSAEAVPGETVGSIDTFRFEEQSVLASCFALVASGRFDDARAILDGRERSFWIDRDLRRKTLWEACRLMIELGLAATKAGGTIAAASETSAVWVERYVASDQGWFQLDRAQRRLEALASQVEDEIDEQALARVRAIYDDVVRRMAEGFLKAFQKDGWSVPGTLHQTRIWPEVVAPCAKPVAYVLVDAMRYEIGVELFERIERFGEVRIRPAIAALPSITPVGMAALLPSASADFSIVTQGTRFGAKVGGSFLPDLSSRQAFISGQISGLVDLSPDEALAGNAKSLLRKIGDAKVIVVRSAEIDGAGENSSTLYARAIMERVVEDRLFASELRCAIYSVNYRLAPEAPHPAPLEDIYSVFAWLHANASRLGLDPARIGIKGESGGGGFAAATALYACDRQGPKFAFQHLIYPMIDDRTAVRKDLHPCVGEFVWTQENNYFGWRSLLGEEPGSAGVSPYAAAARAADVSGLPPTYISVGGLDLFLEENLTYADRLSRAGVPVELHMYPRAYHGFYRATNARVTRQAEHDTREALRRFLHG